MERRREERLGADQEVTLVLLGDPEVRVHAHATNLSGRGMSLTVPLKVPRDTPVRIDWGDRLLLGEVCHCTPDGSGYQVGIELDQALISVSDLARLVSGILGAEKRDRLRECIHWH